MHGASSVTPVSDLIAAHKASGNQTSYGRLVAAFREANVGVTCIGLPLGTSGTLTTDTNSRLSLGLSNHSDGVWRVLAYADPHVFARRFGLKFNADLKGHDVMRTVLANKDCSGILVNSALEEISVCIDRRTIAELLEPKRAWWKIW